MRDALIAGCFVVCLLVGAWAVYLMSNAVGHRLRFGEWAHRDERGGCCNTGLHRSREAAVSSAGADTTTE